MSDELLYAMSVDVSLRLERFYERFRAVYHPVITPSQEERRPEVNIRRQVMRLLEAFGHCEIDYASRRIYMLPATMVLLPSPGSPRALLTGARVPDLVTKLREAINQADGDAELVQESQGQGNVSLPARIVIEAVDRPSIAAICHRAQIDHDLDHDQPAAWRISHLSTTKHQIEEGLSFAERQEPNWPKRVFSVERLRFVRGQFSDDRPVWLAEYRNPTDNQYLHWLWKHAARAEVERDWARYLVLAYQEKHVLLWDEGSRQLAVPVTVPLPTLLARAATLSSGLQPAIVTTTYATAAVPEGHPMLVYHDVLPDIAAVIARTLGQELVPMSTEDFLHEAND